MPLAAAPLRRETSPGDLMPKDVSNDSPTKARLGDPAQREVASAPEFRSTPHPFLQLQRTLGNRLVTKLHEAKRLTPDGEIVPEETAPGQAFGDVQQKLPAGVVPRQPRPADPAVSFDPEVTQSPDGTLAYPTDIIEERAVVRNARKAPPGTTFFWRWGRIDTDKLEPIVGPVGTPEATLKAKARKVADSNVTSEVEVTPPGAPPVSKQTRPSWVRVKPPEPVWNPPIIKYGNLARDKQRAENTIYVGDTFYLSATFNDMRAPKEAGLVPRILSVGIGGRAGDFVWDGRWVNETTFGWEITAPTTAGHRSFTATFLVPGMDEFITHEFELTAVASAEYFKGRCATAESTLNTLHAAGREWFMGCFQNYKSAYDSHNAALEDQAGADRLVGNILLSVALGAVGGLAGGAVGGALRASQETMRATVGNIAEGAITDAAKDFTKAVARIPAQLAGSGGGGGAAPGGPKPTGTATGGAAGRGARAPAAIDPLNWMAAIDEAIAGERKTIGEKVVDAHLAADQCVANNPDCRFDWDPVEVIVESAKIAGKPIDNLGEVPSALEYERAFWEVWLSQYAYHAQYYKGDVPFGSGYAVEQKVGRKLRKRIQAVASKFGETADQWIERYGAPARAAAEKKKREYDER